MDITEIVSKQKAYFASGKTRGVSFRIEMLKKLRHAILENEQAILEALAGDLGKTDFEAFVTEVFIVLNELSYALKHCRKWARPVRVSAGIINFPSTGRIYPDPYGTVLVMSPWNYPFQLAVAPLVAAVAAGNTVVLKPSNYSPATSAVIRSIAASCFPPEYVAVVEGGREANQGLLREQFDYIFFTGGVTVGKLVMESAARFLTPVTLELGGKSPCIVDETADIDTAARRIVWGKCLNSGQTCVAPDYIMAHRDIKDALVEKLIFYIKKSYGEEPCRNPEFPCIINDKHFSRLNALIAGSRTVYGGHSDAGSRKISPAIADGVSWDDPVMQEEIFGPILPVMTFSSLEDAVAQINGRPHPLALYFFTSRNDRSRYVLSSVRFGGGCINDTVVHLTSDRLPFGGVGNSGMGNYHGKAGFDTFTHYKSILKKSVLIDIPIRYAPFGNKYRRFRRFL